MSSEGFERSEPRAGFIAAIGGAIMVLLVLVVLGVQTYYDHVRDQQIFVKQLEPVSEDLKALRAREAEQLHSYRYIDRAKGTVRLPIERAMDLVVEEAHAKK
ncbi:MAG: hypothetical protein ACM336_20590 [Acidobacteriota bacterium]